MEVVLSLATNVVQFAEGRWADLVNESIQSALLGSEVARRKRRRQEDDDVADVQRGPRSWCQWVSCPPLARLWRASVAPGTLRTLRVLTREKSSLATITHTHTSIPPDIDGPEEQLNLSLEALFENIQKARRGALVGNRG